jgi:serine/threonine protein kinase
MKITHKRGQRIPWPVAVGIVAGTLHGLHAAHEAKDERGTPLGLVHRDVSPQNILVGVDGMARVVDFGIAKAGSNIHVTRENAVKGKLGYMAPEQMNQESLTRQVDVYAAGVVLWEALTGKRLFDGESEAIVLSRVLGATIQPPSSIAKDVPPDLDAIVLKALSRDTNVRYRTAKELANALDKITPASSGEIGEWVEQTAKAILDKRAQRITEVEAGSADLEPSEAPTDPPPQPRSEPVTGSYVRSDGRSSHPFGSARTLGKTPGTGARIAAAQAKSRKTAQLITAAVVGAAALTTVAAWALTRSSSNAENARTALAAASTDAVPPQSATATASAAVAPTSQPQPSTTTVTSAASSTPVSASASVRTWSSGGVRPTASSKKSPFDLGGRN